ncbi:MAG: DUF1003 domain-containing protein [Culicoidibacterales bacterium]
MNQVNNKSEVMNDAGNSFGERAADRLASFGGSWSFLISFIIFITFWVILNVWLLQNSAFDPYPFILLNLFLSMLASIQAPIIMMSQNRQEARDRARAELDFEVNKKAELEIRELQRKLDLLMQFHHIQDEK